MRGDGEGEEVGRPDGQSKARRREERGGYIYGASTSSQNLSPLGVVLLYFHKLFWGLN